MLGAFLCRNERLSHGEVVKRPNGEPRSRPVDQVSGEEAVAIYTTTAAWDEGP